MKKVTVHLLPPAGGCREGGERLSRKRKDMGKERLSAPPPTAGGGWDGRTAEMTIEAQGVDPENIRQNSGIHDTWYYGIDYLRCFMSLSVIAWHLRLFGETGFFNIDEFRSHTIGWVDIIYFHVFFLAVPIFFLISLFMFIDRRIITLKYLSMRIERLAYLYLFWLGAGLLVYLNLNNKPMSELFNAWSSSFHQAALVFFSGGFTLYYYFLDLIFLTLFSYVTAVWHCWIQWAMAIVSLMLLWIFPAIVRWFGMWEITVAYWNILNFIPYVFIANLILHYRRRLISHLVFKWLTAVLAFTFIVTACCEWQWFVCIGNFTYNNFAVPPYMRISVAIGTTLLFVISLRVRNPVPDWVKFLSKNSLGLYCLHQIVIIVLQKFERYEIIHDYRIAEYVIVVFICIVLTPVFRRAFRSGLI